MTVSRRDLLRVGGLAVAGMAGCSGGADGPTTVAMTDGFAFDPQTVTVAPGGAVVWRNDSDVGHSVTAYATDVPAGAAYFASGGVDSERAARDRAGGDLVPPGGTYEHVFEVSGVYGYFCVPHESSGMTGTVRVRD